MEIRDLEYLAASATAGNFARAAEAAGISTSTISRRVARLEDELGLALFERGHSGVRLTPGGRAVMQHVRRVLGELEALKSSGSVSGAGDVGEIRLGVRLPPIGTPLLSPAVRMAGKEPEHHPDRGGTERPRPRGRGRGATPGRRPHREPGLVAARRERAALSRPADGGAPGGSPACEAVRGALGRASGGGRPGPGLGREPGCAGVLCRVPR